MAAARPLRRGAALAALACAAGAAGVAPPATAAALPLSLIQDDASLLRAGDARREATLDDIAALGAGGVRIIVLWRDAPGVWPALDAAVAGAQRRGLDVLLTLTGPGPPSASGCRPRDGACRPDPAAYARFVGEAGARYPSVRRWSLWNEPNVPNWLRPQAVVRGGRAALAAPGLYRGLVRAGARALADSGHGKDTILIGETAPVRTVTSGPPATRPTSPLAFTRAVLAGAGGRLPGTGWAHHAYSGGGVRDPALPGPRAALGPARLGVLADELTRAAQRRATARRLPIWITEAGFQTDPPDPFFGVPLATQAAWVNEVDFLLATRRPAVRSVAQYLVRDEPRRSAFQSGLRFADGARKPAWAAYRAPLWVARAGGSASVRVWGAVRPRGATLLAVEHRPRGARRWRVVLKLSGRAVDRRVRMPVRGGRWRLRWRDAAAHPHVGRVAQESGRVSAAGR